MELCTGSNADETITPDFVSPPVAVDDGRRPELTRKRVAERLLRPIAHVAGDLRDGQAAAGA